MKGRRKQGGFTLVELIAVIVILGILSATALPKFVNLSGNARMGVMSGVEGSMRSANSLVYASSALAVPNGLGVAAGTVTINGVVVNTAYGYAATLQPDLLAVMDVAPLSSFNVTATTINAAGAGTPGNCQITYAPPGAANGNPTYTESTNPFSPAGCL